MQSGKTLATFRLRLPPSSVPYVIDVTTNLGGAGIFSKEGDETFAYQQYSRPTMLHVILILGDDLSYFF